MKRKDNATSLWFKFVSSPIGNLKLVASDSGLVAMLWEHDSPRRVRLSELVERPEHPILVRTEKELEEYFASDRDYFTIPLDMRGTDFQKQVWEALLGIPFGQTRTYGQLANQLGNPKATRAVGAANGRNPLAILVPCHRVIGFSGKLTGFAGGLDAKAPNYGPAIVSECSRHALGSHPCRVFSVSYEQAICTYYGCPATLCSQVASVPATQPRRLADFPYSSRSL